jgi:alanyl-tRNA synthetase
VDTTHALPGLVRHRVRVEEGRIIAGDMGRFAVDASRREAIRKNHTATHLLHWALRSVLGEHVKQAGSLVAADRLRFDFSHFKAVTPDELAEAELRANSRVLLNEQVRAFETTKEHAERLGAIAFFGDKYGDVVRVVEAGDLSRELCGGTHVDALGMIGPIVILSEGSIAANMRRIEALSGDAALEHLRGRSSGLVRVGELLRVGPDEVPARVERLLEERSALEGELKGLRRESLGAEADGLVSSAQPVGRARLVVVRRDGVEPGGLRALAEAVRDRLGSGVVVVAGSPDGVKASVVAGVTRDLTGRLEAGDLAAEMAAAVGGGGGKGADLAMAGGRDVAALDTALEKAATLTRARLGA